MKKFILILCLFLVACTDADKAKQVLEDAGYTDIRITGYNYFGCSGKDSYHTGFIATSKSTGRTVEGVVCSAWLKGSTIRLE